MVLWSVRLADFHPSISNWTCGRIMSFQCVFRETPHDKGPHDVECSGKVLVVHGPSENAGITAGLFVFLDTKWNDAHKNPTLMKSPPACRFRTICLDHVSNKY